MKIYSQFIITEDEEQQSGAHFTKRTIEADVVWLNTDRERDYAFGRLSEVAPPSLRRPMPASGASLPAKAASTAPAASSGTVAMLPSSPSATATATPSALPSWIARLSNASIAADMTAADVNGSVSYAGLQKLLVDLDSTVVSSNMGLTSAELSDLKTIVANLNNGMTTSSYLTWVMNALVNGNASNATWTGGAASSTNLGNLASGSSATQLSELIGKWFLGTDLPSSKVSMSGYSSFSVSYSNSSNPLFAASGPSMNDVNQGYLGDCYLLSCLAEVADQNPNLITSMFTSNGNNTYGVRYYVNGVADYVTVNNALANGGNEFNHAPDIWASLAEKAYAQLQAGGVVTGNSVNYGDSWSTIGNGGYPAYALEEITGASAITNFSAYYRGAWQSVTYNTSLSVTGYSSGLSTANVLSILTSDLAKGDDVVLTSYTNAQDSSGKTTLVANHALSIYGYDSATNLLEVRNPWGTMAGQSWNTTFEVSLAALLAAGDTITVDNVGTRTGIVAPVLSSPTRTQTWKLGQAVSFTLPAGTFTDPHGEKLTYRATLADGSSLPAWLTFNTTTGTFTGTVPNTVNGLSIKVLATNTDGAATSETFSVLTPAAVPTVTNPTAAQMWVQGQVVNLALPANTFTDPQGEKLTYQATLANGSALPSWLRFNAATDTFTGTAPRTASVLSLTVKATDTSGLAASETFSVSIAAAASRLAGAISSLPASKGSASAALSHLPSTMTQTLASPLH